MTDPARPPFGTRVELRARQQEWDRFHQWEVHRPKGATDVATAWRWYEEVYDLARQLGAIPTEPRLDMEKVRYLQSIQARLALMKWPN